MISIYGDDDDDVDEGSGATYTLLLHIWTITQLQGFEINWVGNRSQLNCVMMKHC